MPDAMRERDWRAPFVVDIRLTLGVQGRGRGDPTYRVDEAGAIWRTSLTPDGPGTIRVLPGEKPEEPEWRQPGETRVRAQAWGPGANWLLDALPAALGLYDDISGFDADAAYPLIRDAARRHPGFRLSRSGRLTSAMKRRTASSGPFQASACGRRQKPGSGRRATLTRFPSATITCRTWSAGPWRAGTGPTTR